jgi:hypothetical protein
VALTLSSLGASSWHRLVAAPPPAALLHALYGPDARAALAAMAATDATLNRALGGVHLVQPADWPVGPGAAWILAPFVRQPGATQASRFSDGSYGVWYGASDQATAKAEVGHHLAAYLSRTRALPDRLPRQLVTAVASPERPVVDLRVPQQVPEGVLLADSHLASRRFGAECRVAQQWGIVWPSVRRAEGLCVGALRPPLLASAAVAGQCTAVWDGVRVGWV